MKDDNVMIDGDAGGVEGRRGGGVEGWKGERGTWMVEELRRGAVEWGQTIRK